MNNILDFKITIIVITFILFALGFHRRVVEIIKQEVKQECLIPEDTPNE